MPRRLLSALFIMVAGAAIAEPTAPGPTLAAVRQKGTLDCGAHPGSPGFGAMDSQGVYRGLDADFCRAVAAAIFDGDANKVRWTVLNSAARIPALQSGQVDLLSRTLTWSQGRDTASGIVFTTPNFYDGQGFLLRKSLNVTHARDLDGATVCVTSGTTNELNLSDWARTQKITVQPVVFESNQETRVAYASGRCDAYSTDASQLAGIRTALPNPDEHIILNDIISKEPLTPAVRKGDPQWFDIVRWTFFALLIAEELDVTQANVDQMLASENPEIRRLLGRSGDHGNFIGLDNRWAYWAIKAVGNYGEIFERNLGQGSPLKLPRGVNALWTQGGLMFAPPIR